MPLDLHDRLERATQQGRAPTVLAYNRIDGPGSSLDLREFQQALWFLPNIPDGAASDDPSLRWSIGLPRTIGLTIDTGTRIEARPFTPGKICVRSVDYGKETIVSAAAVPPTAANWLVKIVDIFRLSGIMFLLHNLQPGIQSSGLGGSASATTGLCLLANALSGSRLGPIQLISLASRIEQDLGVSITGTQEQANVVFGGVQDYVWFPWGLPGQSETGFGACIRSELVAPSRYHELESRMAIFHSGRVRPSTDVNAAWRAALATAAGYRIHQRKPYIAHRYREALRLSDWSAISDAITEYRNLRTTLCASYMEGATEIQGFAEAHGSTSFPLGAGGGGGILVFAPEPARLDDLRKELREVYREIPFKLRATGHEFLHLPLS